MLLSAHCAHCSLHNNVEQLQAKALTALPDQKSQIEISNYVLNFQNTEGADWRKTTHGQFSIGEGKISLKVCPGLETKTHLAGSTDSNKCIEAIDQSSDYFRKLIFQTILIFDINQLLSGFWRVRWCGSYIRLSLTSVSSNLVMHNHWRKGFFESSWTAFIPRGICPAQMICVLIYLSNQITSVPILERDTFRSFLFVNCFLVRVHCRWISDIVNHDFELWTDDDIFQ